MVWVLNPDLILNTQEYCYMLHVSFILLFHIFAIRAYSRYNPNRAFKSANSNMFVIPKTQLKMENMLNHHGPKLQKSLNTFLKQLK